MTPKIKAEMERLSLDAGGWEYCPIDDFKRGFTARDNIASEQAKEIAPFDWMKAADSTEHVGHIEDVYVEGARWQHQQDQAVVAGYTEANKAFLSTNQIYHKKLAAMKAELVGARTWHDEVKEALRKIHAEELAKLKEEIKCRIQSYDHLDDFNIKLNDEIKKLKEENERLRRCLK